MKKLLILIIGLVLVAAVGVGCYAAGAKPNDQQMQQQYQAGYDSRDAEIAHINAERDEQMAALNAERAEQVAALNAQIATLQEQLDNAPDPDTIAALNAQIAELEAQIEELQNQGGTTQNGELQNVVESLKDRDNNLQQQFSHLIILDSSNKHSIFVNLITSSDTPISLEEFIDIANSYSDSEMSVQYGLPAGGVANKKQVVRLVHSTNGFFLAECDTGTYEAIMDNNISQFYDFVTQIA